MTAIVNVYRRIKHFDLKHLHFKQINSFCPFIDYQCIHTNARNKRKQRSMACN